MYLFIPCSILFSILQYLILEVHELFKKLQRKDCTSSKVGELNITRIFILEEVRVIFTWSTLQTAEKLDS